MRSYTMLFLLIILTFVIMPLAVAWQSDPVSPRLDALESRVATLEAWVFTPTNEHIATPVNTPTAEINVRVWAINDNTLQNVRSCAGATAECPVILEIAPRVGFWLCLNTRQLTANGYLWQRVYAQTESWTAIRQTNGKPLLTVTSERETLPANDRGCDG